MHVFEGRGQKIKAGGSSTPEYTRPLRLRLRQIQGSRQWNERSPLRAGPAQTAVVQVGALNENLRHNRYKDSPMILILIVIVSYLIGSIPSGYLVANSQGIDIRQHGSKNIGATNVLRVMGKKWGYLVFFCDGFKGFLVVRLGIFLGTLGGIESSIAGVVAAIACILGHNYTFWLGFKGGKGIATSGGVVLALFPWFIVLIVALVWVVIFYLSRYVSLASICAAISLPMSLVLMSPWIGGSNFWVLILFSILAAGLAVWRHRTNITRLLSGTESRFGKKESES